MSFSEGTLLSLRGEWKFLYSHYKTFCSEALKPARFSVEISEPRMYEVHYAWNDDIARVEDRETALQLDGLDHFKLAGHLAFWLRRFTPMVELRDLSYVDSYDPMSERELEFRQLLQSYGNEYLAFEYGLNLVRFYEMARAEGASPRASVNPSLSFYKMTVHFMKFKTVSPHAMNLIYKGLFNE